MRDPVSEYLVNIINLIERKVEVDIMAYECCSIYGRRYLTRAEKIDLLKEYKVDLENELKGVEERIKELGETI